MSSKFFAIFLSAALLALPFDFPALFPLAWIAFVPFFWAIRETTPRRALLLGWLMGMVTHLVGFYWLNYTIKVFGGYSYSLSALIFTLFIAGSGSSFALFAFLVHRCGFGPLNLFPAFFWVAIEFLYPSLFPWHLANSQSQFPTLIQSSDLIGPYGTSFLLMWVNATLYSTIFSGVKAVRIKLREVAILIALCVAALLYGHLRLRTVATDMQKAPALTVAAIQGGIDIKRKWDITYMESNLRAYLDLTRSVKNARLVVWPESAVEAWVPEDIQQLPQEVLPALKPDSFLIFGARSFRGNPRGPDLKAFNSVFLTYSQGKVLDHYHKQVLLAFGEYIPFAALLSKLPGIPSQVEGFTPGDGPRTLDLPGGVKAAPLICYEDLMPNLARAFVAQTAANLLVNFTNDAWFGDTVGPWQHARLAQWRAIETRRYLVRVTNTGITSIIDPKGEMVQSLPTFSPGVLTAEVRTLEGQTLYVRFGDWFAWVVTFASLVILAQKIPTKKKAAP